MNELLGFCLPNSFETPPRLCNNTNKFKKKNKTVTYSIVKVVVHSLLRLQVDLYNVPLK